MSGEPFSYAQLQEQLNKSKETITKLLNIIDNLNEREKEENSSCVWKWKQVQPSYYTVFVECKEDIVVFHSRRIFTYCPYCGKKIVET